MPPLDPFSIGFGLFNLGIGELARIRQAKTTARTVGISKAATEAAKKRTIEASIFNEEDLAREGIRVIAEIEAQFAKVGVGLGETSIGVILAAARNIERNIRVTRSNAEFEAEQLGFEIQSLTEQERAARKSSKLFGLF